MTVPKSFWRFLESLSIDTKEKGKIKLSRENLMGTQLYFIEEVFRAIAEGVHMIICLKGRQEGITTICLAIDLYWVGKYDGTSGSLITHDEATREMLRTTLTMYLEGLPPEFKHGDAQNNRTQLVLKNRSRVMYMVAGKRKNSSLGKGTALTFCHATEVSEYGDEEGLASLQASFAEQNPNRLFIFESTAQGYNAFYDMWCTAKDSTQQRAVFVGWWRNQFYRKKKGSMEHRVYWDGKLSPEERKWVAEIKQLYGFDIDDEQIAWWRWNLQEKTGDEQLMFQNFPPTESYAFIKSGTNFFNLGVVNTEYKKALRLPPHNYRFILRDNFGDTELNETNEKMANLKIWEFPKPGGYYVIGADPAWGSSEWADRFCASVFRCYADGMEQVAEFCTPDCSAYQFAWVVCYLAGAYGSSTKATSMLNLEINGPGQGVWQEMLNLKRVAANTPQGGGRGILDVVGSIQNFMYKRPDSFGAPSAYHTQSSTREKERMFNVFKDGFERGMIKVVSKDCIDEMNNIERQDGFLGAPGRGKDDRVVAAALATIAWTDFVRLRLVQQGLSKNEVAQRDQSNKGGQSNVATYLRAIGMNGNKVV